MRTFFSNIGETTSMYANRPRSCRRNDFDVCESTCMRIDLYAKRPASGEKRPDTILAFVCLLYTAFVLYWSVTFIKLVAPKGAVLF